MNVKINKVITLLSTWTNENKLKAVDILKDITKNFDHYLELEENNPNKNILYLQSMIVQEFLLLKYF